MDNVDLSINKNLIKKFSKITLPIILQFVLSNCIMLISNIMVGSLGTLAITSVSIVNQIMAVFMNVLYGITAGIGVFTIQYFGIKDYNKVGNTFRIKTLVIFIMNIISITILYLFSEKIIEMYISAADEDDKIKIFNMVYLYLKYLVIALIPFSITQIYASLLRESGNTNKPLIASFCGLITSIILQYILINGNLGFEAKGIEGVGIAVVASRLVEMIINVICCHYYDFSKYFFNSLKIDFQLLIKSFKSTYPLMLDEMLFNFSIVLCMQIYAMKSVDNIAIMNIVGTVSNIVICIAVALGLGSEIVIGHELGKNNLLLAKRIAKKILKITFVIGMSLGLVLILISNSIINLYNIPENLKITTSICIKETGLCLSLLFTSSVNFFILRSGGKTILVLLYDILYTYCIQLLVQYMLIKYTDLSLEIVFLIISLCFAIKLSIGLILMNKGYWIKNLTK